MTQPPDDRLSLVIEHADGQVSRWGPDELDAADVPGGVRFTTSIPGGDKSLDCELLRRINLDYADQQIMDRVRLVAAGNETVWDGILTQFPRQHGDRYSVSPGGLGWSSLLSWNRGFQMIYCDRDLKAWQGAGTQRRINLIAASYGTPTDPAARTDSGSPAVATEIVGAWTGTSLGISEAWYDAGPGNTIDKLYYAWTKGANVDHTLGGWSWTAHLSSTDTASGLDSTANLKAVGPGTGTLTSTDDRRYAIAQLLYASAGGTDNTPYGIDWTCLTAYGPHGLTLTGTASATTGQGVLGSDVIEHVLQQTTPEIDVGEIETTSLAIIHLAFPTQTTAEDVILTVNGYHLYDWGVYTGLNRRPTFFYRYPDLDRCCWVTRLDEGCTVNDDGPQGNDVYDGVVVTYTDAAGRPHSVGPPGASVETESTDLVTTDETNPVVRAGLSPKWGTLDISAPIDEDTAIHIGRVWLLERSIELRRGQITVTGTVTHPTAGRRPVWAIKAGDSIRVEDAGKTLGVARKVIETNYSHADRSNVLTLDTPAWTLDALLERIGVAQVGRT
jgi:hypothetical protein